MLKRLADGEILVGDGAQGSFLMARGWKAGDCLERLNLERPEVVEEVAAAYAEAGADLLTTNSFGGSPLALERHGLDNRVEEINRRAVESTGRAAAGRALVSASVGPSGRLLEPFGDVAPAVVEDGFRRQIAALAEAGADLLCIETMTDLNEARLALAAARLEAPGLPVMASMTFEETLRGFFTIMGVSVSDAVAGLTDGGAVVIGTNCGYGLDLMVAIAEEFTRLAEVPVLVQANAGLPTATADGVVYPEDPEYFGERVPKLLDLGVLVVGGCCGTTPEHVREIRRRVDAWVEGREG